MSKHYQVSIDWSVSRDGSDNVQSHAHADGKGATATFYHNENGTQSHCSLEFDSLESLGLAVHELSELYDRLDAIQTDLLDEEAAETDAEYDETERSLRAGLV